jgi:glycosyltransferase involved in cell wall biosynthesis|tara:strand:+ start:18489 stop:19631 length:1143 start_codon:yes stop_codon:yes gene_type:complete
MSNNEPPKILFLVTHLHKGGMQRAISNISKSLVDAGIPHEIAYFGKDEIVFQYYAKLIDLNAEGKKNELLFIKMFRFIKRLLLLQRLIIKNDIDIIVSFGIISNLINIFTYNKKTITTIRSYAEVNSNFGTTTLLTSLMKLIYKYSDNIVCVSEDLKYEMIERSFASTNKISVINNLFDTETINKLANEQITKTNKIIFEKQVIINLSSLVPDKGHIYLINSFYKAKQEIHNLQLVILGSGPFEEEIKLHINSLDLNKSVHLLGFKKNPFKYLAKSDLYVHTSLYEGFPNSLVEAMICGLPVISTNCKTGPSEILMKKYGILVENINKSNHLIVEKNISNHIVDLLKAKNNLYYRSQALLRSKEYSINKLSKKWIELLTK